MMLIALFHPVIPQACYRDKLGRTKAYRYLPYLCDVLPVHFIWGEMPDPIL